MNNQIKKMLEAIRSFHFGELILTPEEVKAFDETSHKPRPKVKPKQLPKKPADGGTPGSCERGEE